MKRTLRNFLIVAALVLCSLAHATTTDTRDVIRVIPPATVKQSLSVQTANDAGLDNGTIIDLAVFYSGAARTALGGDIQTQTFALQMVQSDNMVLANSQVISQLRLVYAGLYPLAETGDGSTDLMQMQQNTEVKAIRDLVGADMVQLITKTTGGSCGISYIEDPAGSWFAPYAFSVVPYGCVSGYSSAHEFGHGFGNDHDPADTTGGGAFSFSQGFQGKTQRDVMAYGSTTRVPCFSNGGRFLWAGAALGNSVSDAARTIQLTSVTVARFRQSVLSPVQTPTPTPSPTPILTPQPAPTATPAPGTAIVNGPSTITVYQSIVVTWAGFGKSGKTEVYAFFGDKNGSKGKPELGYVSVSAGTLKTTLPGPTGSFWGKPFNGPGTPFWFVIKPDATGLKTFSNQGIVE